MDVEGECCIPKMTTKASKPSRIISDTIGVRPNPARDANSCFAIVRKRILVCVHMDMILK